MAAQKIFNFHINWRIFMKLVRMSFLGGWLQIYGQK